MARPRKPTHLKLVQGTQKKCRLNPEEPKPPVVELPVPYWLSDDAKSVWDRVAGMLHRMGILTELDQLALEELCETYAVIVQCRKVLDAAGDLSYLSKGERGGEMRRALPEVAILADADRRLRAYLNDFGMTPASRSKVRGNGEAEADPADKYFGT